MIKYTTFFVLLILLVNAACSSGQNKTMATKSDESEALSTLENDIIGKWTNSTIDVDLSTYNNSDTSFHVSITEDNWQIKMNIQPILTDFNDDGTFLNRYLDTLGNAFHSNTGIWYIDGDSLFLEEEEGEIYNFKVLINGNIMEMQTILDYDEDGNKDDQYFGKYKRLTD